MFLLWLQNSGVCGFCKHTHLAKEHTVEPNITDVDVADVNNINIVTLNNTSINIIRLL